MQDPCWVWWRNCVLEADAEIEAIDRMQDALGPLDPGIARVRSLIGSLELCHHLAARWIDNIVVAIAEGDTNRGLGTRPSGRRHEAEDHWQSVCDELSAWCAGAPASASPLLASLGERTALKVWQVERVVEKINASIGWPSPSTEYVWLLLAGGENEADYRDECPEQHRGQADRWLVTVETTIVDTVDGVEAELSLALAIDMLMPCHWRFDENLRVVLAAIGGELAPTEPFAACGRNICLLPGRPRLERTCVTLRAFCDPPTAEPVDEALLLALGEPTPARRWLAASLEKTIRLQLDPPPDVRAVSALSGPAWLDEPKRRA